MASGSTAMLRRAALVVSSEGGFTKSERLGWMAGNEP
jgi:hypothetical protein